MMNALRLLAVLALFARAATAQLSIQFLDVGQGDAALIRAPHTTVLVDAGPSPDRVAAWLRAAGVDTIDLVVASHNHADHIGGMPAVLARFPVRNYMDNGMVATTRTYSSVVGLLEARGINVLQATRRRIDLRDGVAIRVLGSTPDARTQNDASIGLELTYGRFRALFTGDAELRQREFWLTDSLKPVQVLKVSHHGSVNGTDLKLLRAITPCAAVISVGARNSFGHPSARVLTLLRTAHARTYRTDEVGQVSITADSSGAFRVAAGRRGALTSTFTQPCR